MTMFRRAHVWGILAVVLLAAHAFATTPERVVNPVDYLPFDPGVAAVLVFAWAVLLSVLSVVLQNNLTNTLKKIIFIVVAVPVVVVTLYMAGSTVYLNLTSWSGGPVHWHADYEVWVCNEHVTNFEKPVFPSNKVGTEVLHHHEDYRMHVEGLVIREGDVSLESYFKALGWEFDNDSLSMHMDDGTVRTVRNGDECPDGSTGSWRMYKKDWETGDYVGEPAMKDFVLAPEFHVPPGDYLVLVFDAGEGLPSNRKRGPLDGR